MVNPTVKCHNKLYLRLLLGCPSRELLQSSCAQRYDFRELRILEKENPMRKMKTMVANIFEASLYWCYQRIQTWCWHTCWLGVETSTNFQLYGNLDFLLPKWAYQERNNEDLALSTFIMFSFVVRSYACLFDERFAIGGVSQLNPLYYKYRLSLKVQGLEIFIKLCCALFLLVLASGTLTRFYEDIIQSRFILIVP